MTVAVPELVLDERATKLAIDVAIPQKVLDTGVGCVATGFEVGIELAVMRVASALDHRGHRCARDWNFCRVSRCSNLRFSQRRRSRCRRRRRRSLR